MCYLVSRIIEEVKNKRNSKLFRNTKESYTNPEESTEFILILLVVKKLE